MKVTLETLQKSSVALTIELDGEEVLPYLERAAQRLSERRPVPGFRPGKAPYGVMAKLLGAATVYDEALTPMVRATLPNVIAEHKLQTVGAPKIDVVKLAPDNPVIYKATVGLLPRVELGDYKSLKVKRENVTVTNDEVDALVQQLRESLGKERVVSRPAREGDKVEVDFTGYLDKVPMEGASSTSHPIVIGSKHFVPGFEEQLVGLKAGEEKEFTIRFPENYYQTSLANRDVEFRVKALAVYQIDLPDLNDTFARSMGPYKSIEDLRKHLEQRIKNEKLQKERERYETAMLEKILEISKVDDLPDLLVDGEVAKMLEELQASVSERGMEFDKYLESIKKTRDDLRKEFLPRAEKRLRLALLTRQLAEAEHLEARDDEVRKEIEETKALYKGDPEVLKNLHSPDYFSYLKNSLTTRRIYEYLDEIMGVDEE